MSIKLVVRVMEEADVPRPWAAVLLAMADHADDEGRNCYPSVDRIAWKANYKPRQVVNIMRELAHVGIISQVRPAGQHRPAEYRIHLDRAANKLPFETWRERFGRDATSRPSPAVSQHQPCSFATPALQNGDADLQSRDPDVQPIAPEPLDKPSNNPLQNRERAARTRRPHPLPEDFVLTEQMYEWAATDLDMLRVEVDHETAFFVDHFTARGDQRVDWGAEWRKWLRRAGTFADRPVPHAARGTARDRTGVPQPPKGLEGDALRAWYMQDFDEEQRR